ncbi:MAG TPA: hypothetical protein VF398_00920 [bacterium]|jgi:hypothetical protein
MLRRTLLIAMLMCLLVGLAQARVYDDSKAVVPGLDFSRGSEPPPMIARHVPMRGDWSQGHDLEGMSRLDGREPELPPTIRRHDRIDRGWPHGYDPIRWGFWMLMKSFGGGN